MCIGHFEGDHHYLHCLDDSLASGQTTGREHSPAHKQKIGLKIYWAWPHPKEQDPVSPSVSLSHRSFISLLTLPVRGQTEWKPQSQKTNQTDHMDHSLVYSVKLWAMPCRAHKEGWVMVESSDKTWSTRERNSKPLNYSCLKMNSPGQ